MTDDTILWQPTAAAIAAAPLTRFAAFAADLHGAPQGDYDDLHRWSIDHTDLFWDALWDFCGVVGEKGGQVLVDGDRMPGARFFPEAKINFAENLLRGRGNGDALVFRAEDKVARRMSWDELAALV